jgi:hypothetical protein
VASGPVSNQARVLNDQDTALFRQGLAAARARDVIGARNAAAQIGDPTARKLVEWALLDTSAAQLPWSDLVVAQSRFAGWPRAEAAAPQPSGRSTSPAPVRMRRSVCSPKPRPRRSRGPSPSPTPWSSAAVATRRSG